MLSHTFWVLSKQRYFRYFYRFLSRETSISERISSFKEKVSRGPPLSTFLNKVDLPHDVLVSHGESLDVPPYLSLDYNDNKFRKVYIETYGCQMNVSDTEIVNSILVKAGYTVIQDIKEADIIFVMTCAVREGAEQKIWRRLKYFKHLMKKKSKFQSEGHIKVGILGCMAERLKHKLIEKEKLVDIVAGPDSYKDLPNLLSLASEGEKAVNVMLSADETYADIMPVRINNSSKSAYVSIMRGCDNMCAFCIVPFTRGRERSRPLFSILDEVRNLSDQGVKEITLLGQNVNSYRDISQSIEVNLESKKSSSNLSSGFHTVYKTRIGGLRFADLLAEVADVNPEIRIRFTSPHPKDFPDEVLHVINEKPNICKLLHLPAQSGSSNVLQRMRRGYTREAYLELIDHIRSIISGVAFTSDFICGFCEETEEEHQDTLSLIEKVKYEFAYIFPYSMREKTRAYHRLNDNVPEEIKKKRADEAYNLFRAHALDLHLKEIGKHHLIQVLGPSKRSELDWSGRNDWNTKVIYPQVAISSREGSHEYRLPLPGDYIVVEVTGCTSQVLKGKALYHTTLQDFYSVKYKKNYAIS